MLFLLSLHLKMSFVSVVFDFNASLSDVAPVFSIKLSVDFMKTEKSGLLMDIICVLFLFCSPFRLNCVSALFDFNASLNDVAPVFPMSLAVYTTITKKKKNGLFMDTFCVCVNCSFCIHIPGQVEGVLCLISKHHSLRLLLCL